MGVADTPNETMPCRRFHLRRLSAKVKEGIEAAGGTPMEFNTIAISDGETMGTEEMRACAGQPRTDCRLHRTGLPRTNVRRSGLRRRLRQDHSRRRNGVSAAERSLPGLVLYGKHHCTVRQICPEKT